MTAELLRAEDLRLEREGVGRLDHMDFTVTAGDSIGVVGLSGGGKTALAEVLCGEREPDQGRVWYEGRPAGRELLSRLGFRIRGDSALVRNLSVAENLLILGRPVGERRLFCRERPLVGLCREFLRDFGLEAWTDAPPAEIPPAVQHRLLLVSALMRKKRLIALDHVADVYTAQEQALLADCIQSVCERGAAALYLSGVTGVQTCALPISFPRRPWGPIYTVTTPAGLWRGAAARAARWPSPWTASPSGPTG